MWCGVCDVCVSECGVVCVMCVCVCVGVCVSECGVFVCVCVCVCRTRKALKYYLLGEEKRCKYNASPMIRCLYHNSSLTT